MRMFIEHPRKTGPEYDACHCPCCNERWKRTKPRYYFWLGIEAENV